MKSETRERSSWSVEPDAMCVECLVLRKENVSASEGEGEREKGRWTVGTSLFPWCVEAGVRG